MAPRTRNNLRGSIAALFGFAKGRKYLPKDHDELEAVPVAKDAGGEIEIFTPGEMAELLAVATPEVVPFLAIGAFAGVRHAELQRLDWANVKREGDLIEIRAGKAKTASRRVIPILPNLRAWLAPHWEESGLVCPYESMTKQFERLTSRVNAEAPEQGRKQGAESGGIGVCLEAQCAAAFFHQLPGGADAERGASGAGGGKQSADDFQALPRTRATGGRGGVV